MTDLFIVNQSTLVAHDDVARWAAAIQVQVTRDLAPVWGTGGRLWFQTAPVPGAWSVILKDAPDDPNDLGFHLLDGGVPEARIFVRPTLAAGDAVSTVLSHEVLEMLVDPRADRMAPDGAHIVEVCDPVQGTPYRIDDVEVSDFVTPTYFKMVVGGAPYDHLNRLAGPVDVLLAGGYIMTWTGIQWQSKFARLADGSIHPSALARAVGSGRSFHRAARGAPIIEFS